MFHKSAGVSRTAVNLSVLKLTHCSKTVHDAPFGNILRKFNVLFDTEKPVLV